MQRGMGGTSLCMMALQKQRQDGKRKVNQAGNSHSWCRQLNPLQSEQPMYILVIIKE